MVENKIWDSKLECEKRFGKGEETWNGVRPLKALDLQNDFLFNDEKFDYEKHCVWTTQKLFSKHGFEKGFEKISEFLRQPLYFKKKK